MNQQLPKATPPAAHIPTTPTKKHMLNRTYIAQNPSPLAKLAHDADHLIMTASRYSAGEVKKPEVEAALLFARDLAAIGMENVLLQNDGAKACRMGQPLSSNPHPCAMDARLYEVYAHHLWVSGWQTQAAEDAALTQDVAA